MKRFADLTEPEVLALAISNEEEDARIYLNSHNRLRRDYPASARSSKKWPRKSMAIATSLLALYDRIRRDAALYHPPGRAGFLKRNPVWLLEPAASTRCAEQAEIMEFEAASFYAKAAERACRRRHRAGFWPISPKPKRA